LHRRQEQGDQDPDDGNDHQQLDDRETTAVRRFASHDIALLGQARGEIGPIGQIGPNPDPSLRL
jgi:hypothetical protein